MRHVYNCTGHELKIPNIVESQGIYLFDEHGKRYMDLESGVWCISIGHRNQGINEIIARQSDILIQAGFCYSNEVVDASAGAVLDITGLKGGRCVFLCSGSEAIEISRQIAGHITEKQLSMTLHDSYLGAYSSVSSRKENWYIFNWEQCRICPGKSNCDPDCKKLKNIPEDISDFIFEPGSSSGYVKFPPESMIKNIVKKVRKNGGRIIVNEVTTGVGRTGEWFGYHHYDIQPDMVAIGKGIGNGYPVSVAAINRETMEELEKKPFKYSQSHQNDPLGAAVVKKVISIIEKEDLVAEAKTKGLKFLSQLEALVDNKIVLAARGRGLMMAIDLADREVTEDIYSRLIGRGFIVGNRGTSLRIDPPLIVTEDEFMEFICALKDTINT